MKKSLIIIMIGIIMIAVSCEKVDNGACGNGKFSEEYAMYLPSWQGQYEKFTGLINKDIVYYNYPGSGKVQFVIAKKQENICPEKHVNIYFEIALNRHGDLINKLPLRIFGEAYWSLGFQNEEVQLFNGIKVPNYIIGSGISIGLKQAFGSKKGFVNLFLTVEFDTNGSFSQDSTLFVNNFDILYIECSGDKFE